MTHVVACNPAMPDTETVRRIVAVLTEGRAVVMPTETQYALSLRADRDETADAITQIKQRPMESKCAIFVRDLTMAATFCELSTAARTLARKYLPGPLTMVLPAKPGQSVVSDRFRSAHGFGIRISSSPLVAAVMTQATFPVTATSANQSGEITLPTVQGIRQALGDDITLYVDGGPCRAVTASTVAAVAETVTILRHGLIAEAEIRRFLREEGLDG